MRRFFTLMLALAVSLFALTACDEAQYDPALTPPPSDGGAPPDAAGERTPVPEPEPDMALPDEWPAEYLPENFPMPEEFISIQNVRRENGEIKVTVTTAANLLNAFRRAFHDLGYLSCPLPVAVLTDEKTVRDCYFNQEGTVCDMSAPRPKPDSDEPYVWEITVKFHQTFDFDASAYFIDWPPLDTDLGLEELVFDKWPAEYLPDGFPEPIGMTPVSMAQKKNGVFITFAGNTGSYFAQIEDAGYARMRSEGLTSPDYYKNPEFNGNKDRVYHIRDQAEIDAIHSAFASGAVPAGGTKDTKTMIQVIKGEDTGRYWQSLKEE